ncbi:MAG: hypothetical protein ABUL60_22565 [Myxococcales bacterium]
MEFGLAAAIQAVQFAAAVRAGVAFLREQTAFATPSSTPKAARYAWECGLQ